MKVLMLPKDANDDRISSWKLEELLVDEAALFAGEFIDVPKICRMPQGWKNRSIWSANITGIGGL